MRSKGFGATLGNNGGRGTGGGFDHSGQMVYIWGSSLELNFGDRVGNERFFADIATVVDFGCIGILVILRPCRATAGEIVGVRADT